MTTLTQAQFARHLGVDRAHITRLKQAGRLVLTPAGQVDVEASEARIAATADPAKAPVADRHAAGRAAAVDGQNQPKTAPEEEGDPIAGTPDYQKARARREEANANIAEIELAERAGHLMETAAVVAVLADAGATCRSMLETLPAILAPQLATLSDDHACRQLLEEHIGSALNELSDRLGGVTKGAA
jgi:phage terminase Nu1 subunit (DNA packaging protein)